MLSNPLSGAAATFATALATAAALIVAPAGASRAEDSEAVAELPMLKPDIAVELARAAQTACREQGYQVTVAVVDRSGLLQVLIRDRFAGPHTIPTAEGKAWTATSFRGSTLELDRMINNGELAAAIRDIPGVLMLGGGLPIEAAGSVVGGVGVSGAPDPAIDEGCAEAGIEAIADRLDF